MKGLSQRWRKTPAFLEEEKGQAIVIIAFAAIALLLFAGLALDAAAIYAGQSRLKRAVDASALAGVVELPNQDAAEQRTRQFMRANGFDTYNQEMLPVFEFARLPASGYLQWIVTATYRVPLNFLPLINFDYAEVREVAVAEYRALVDVFTTQTGGRGIVGPVNLSSWGRYANPKWGDAFTPECWTCDVSHGHCPEELVTNALTGEVLNCPPGSMRDVIPDGFNPDRIELHNEFGRGYPFRIHIPPAYDDDKLQIEILDPDGYNQPLRSSITISHTDDSAESVADCGDRADVCLLDTGPIDEDINDYWFVRLDENCSFGGCSNSYDPKYNTQTEYRLFYHKQLPDRSIVREDLGTYVGGASDASTDMQWIMAWELDVSCGDGCDIPDIRVNEDGSRSLRLEVDGVSGYSKNGFDLWAGPPPITETIPLDVNARNLYLLSHRGSHDTGGVVVFGSGYLPVTVNKTGLITMTFAFIPIQAAGIGMNLFHFDNDLAGYSMDYYLDGVPDWQGQGRLSGDGAWGTTDFQYQPPGSRQYDHIVLPDEFYGGYLVGRYQSLQPDNSSWRIEYEGVVGEMFVRLIQ